MRVGVVVVAVLVVLCLVAGSTCVNALFEPKATLAGDWVLTTTTWSVDDADFESEVTYSNATLVSEGEESEAFSGLLNLLDGTHGGLSNVVAKHFFRIEFETSLSGAVRIGEVENDEADQEDELGLKTLFSFSLQETSPASAYVSHGVLGDKLYTLTMMSPDALLLTVTDLKTKSGYTVSGAKKILPKGFFAQYGSMIIMFAVFILFRFFVKPPAPQGPAQTAQNTARTQRDTAGEAGEGASAGAASGSESKKEK